MATFNRERVPERVVHAKGSGAFGTLTITNDITKYTKAKVFSEIGKKTEMLARFSTVAGERGAADALGLDSGKLNTLLGLSLDELFEATTEEGYGQAFPAKKAAGQK